MTGGARPGRDPLPGDGEGKGVWNYLRLRCKYLSSPYKRSKSMYMCICVHTHKIHIIGSMRPRRGGLGIVVCCVLWARYSFLFIVADEGGQDKVDLSKPAMRPSVLPPVLKSNDQSATAKTVTVLSTLRLVL